MSVKDNLIRILKERDITVYRLVKESEISYSSVFNIASGKNKNPQIYTLKKIADHLNISVEEFLK